ncbi:MAG: hypothetical protein DME48_04745 [Verrucomicrobia bacterium]|jgi:hypothetical protein|nr:MAG: hypothetical protein DME48_04745 [Verrucomicrobiota bacterium]
MFFKYLASAFIIFLLACIASLSAAERGFLEGHLKIVFGMAAEGADDMPRQSVTMQNYAEYPLVILDQDGTKSIARVTADANGNYHAALPPGNYILDMQDRVAKHLRARPQPFSVVSNQTVHVDMNVIIGFR